MSDPANQPTRKSKIARLPASIREDLNRRIHDGETGKKILSWLNDLPGVQVVDPISEQNLSVWRAGGYADWLKKQERFETGADESVFSPRRRMAEESARRGKISKLPASIREELNRRLHDGEIGNRILAWLNALPEVISILERLDEDPITAQNLSVWRSGGYADWLRRRDRVEQTKVLSQYAFDLAKAAGSSISDGAAAILGGQILEAVEQLSESDEGEQKLVGFALAMSKLRDADSKMLRARVAERNATQKDRQLDLDERKFQRTTAKLFLKWAASEEARTILGSGETEAVQMDKLVQLFFGTAPDLQPPSIP